MSASSHSTRAWELLASALFGALLLLIPAPPGVGSSPIELARPVNGEVLRGFDSQGKYAKGHTGVDFSTTRGSIVRSAASGRVVFAGSVAGNESITISHAGGWLTTYSYLLEGRVSKGDEVASGQEIGLSGKGTFLVLKESISHSGSTVSIEIRPRISLMRPCIYQRHQ